MDIRAALKEQYHAGLSMLAQCVERCPDDLWLEGVSPRFYWRIVFHTAFFTHLYLGQDEAAFEPWPGRRSGVHTDLWECPADVEPYELSEGTEIYSQKEMLDYLSFIDFSVDSMVDALDLDSLETGFSWYKNMTKLSHQLVNLRHVQGHIGQLSELLMMRGIDIDWVGKGSTRH